MEERNRSLRAARTRKRMEKELGITDHAIASMNTHRVFVQLTEERLIRVLHVDDERALLKVAKECLEMQGAFEVETASSVQEAMQKMKRKTFDVIVSDYFMPEKDGLEFLKELRKKGNKVPFIVLTGKGQEEVAIKALNFGADRYVNKAGAPEIVYAELAHSIKKAAEAKWAEDARLRAEEKLRSIFASSPDAITVIDLNGNITECNQATLNMLGFSSKDELIGKSGFALVAEKDRERVRENLKKLLEQGSIRNSEYIALTKDGREFHAELSSSVIRDSVGNPTCFVAVTRDITERKKAEKELRLLSSVVQQTSEAIAVFDMERKIVFANSAWAEMHGYEAEELTEKDVSIFYKKPEIVGLFEERVRSKGFMRGRIVHVRKDGSVFPALTTLTLLKDERGKPTGIARIVKDIRDIVKDIRDVGLLPKE